MPKKLVLLGCTGSIGQNTLEVVRRDPDHLSIVALSAHTRTAGLAGAVREFGPRAVAVSGPGGAGELTDLCAARGIRLYEGREGLLEMIGSVEGDTVVNAISGSGGLLPSLRALESGKDLANANKESIVMAGPLILEAAGRKGRRLVPIDSEHFALFSLLRRIGRQNIGELILTASGGPFLRVPLERLKDVRLRDALSHPNWKMGPKNTIDSATMANKGLELIESRYLFDVEPSRLKVLIHPQSIVHSLVRAIDGRLFAQLSQPDMRLVIAGALAHPELSRELFGTFDLVGRQLTFLPLDLRRFRLVALAYRVLEEGGAYPLAFNAANEVAFGRFLREEIPFAGIPAVVEETLQGDWHLPVGDIEAILAADQMVRTSAEGIAARYQGKGNG